MSEDMSRLDYMLSRFMQRWSLRALRVSFGVVFVWFGILKPLGMSPAEPLLLATVGWIPVLDGPTWLVVIGWWEVVIGLTFLLRGTERLAVGLLAVHMAGTLLPLFLLPDVTFQSGRFPFGPTMEGQYIIKNLFIISAGLVLGGTAPTPARPTRPRVRRIAARASKAMAPRSVSRYPHSHVRHRGFSPS